MNSPSSVKTTFFTPNMSSGTEGYHEHLKALIRRENNPVYQRKYYMSREWQETLRKEVMTQATNTRFRQDPSNERDSPRSVLTMTPSKLCPTWREKICEWQYQVVDRYDLNREIVGISTFYLDRYLCMFFADEDLFQLLSMTCLYLAIKIHSPIKLSIRSMARLGRGLISVEHITEMEICVMQALGWYLHPPTPTAFLDNFFPIISKDLVGNNRFDSVDVYEFSRFLAELSVCAYPFVAAMPSSIAIAAILLSIDHFQLSEETKGLFKRVADTVCLDVDSFEVVECKKLLLKVYMSAVSQDYSADDS